MRATQKLTAAILACLASGAPTLGQAAPDESLQPPLRPAVSKPSSDPAWTPAKRYWPAKAAKAGVGGEVTMACQVTEKGKLDACAVISAMPAEYDFGVAALRMASTGAITAAPPPADRPAAPNGVWRFRIEFYAPKP